MSRRNLKPHILYNDGDAHEQPSVDDLQVAAAAAACDEVTSEETTSSENSRSENSYYSSTDDSDEPESSTLPDDAIPQQETVQLSLAFNQNGTVSAKLLLQHHTNNRNHLAEMIEFCSDGDDDTTDDAMTSTSEDEVDNVDIAYDELRAIIDGMDDDDDNFIPVHGKSAAEELFGSAQPVPLDVTLLDDDVISLAGNIQSIIEGTIVVRAEEGSRVLQEGSVLVLESKAILGAVEDIFGPVQAPLYALRCAGDVSSANGHGGGLLPEGLIPGATVYSVDRLCDFVLPDDLRVKGYDDGDDGGGTHEDGLQRDPAMQFSDDEAEAEYKRKLKAKRKKERDGARTTENEKSTPSKGNIKSTHESKKRGMSTKHHHHHHYNNNNNNNNNNVMYPLYHGGAGVMSTMMPMNGAQAPPHGMATMLNAAPQQHPFALHHPYGQQGQMMAPGAGVNNSTAGPAFYYPGMFTQQQQPLPPPPPPPPGGHVPRTRGGTQSQQVMMMAHATAGQFGGMSIQPHHVYQAKGGAGSRDGQGGGPPRS